MKDGKCSKCGSGNLATGVATGGGFGASGTAMCLETPKNPGGWFSTLLKRPLVASVCGECGYTEFYLQEPKEFVELGEAETTRLRAVLVPESECWAWS